MEEIGSRATIFELEGLGSEKRKYLKWLLVQSVAQKTKIETVIADDAFATLSEQLSTPLQFEYYLTRALEEACKVGQKPVGADMIENVLARRRSFFSFGWPASTILVGERMRTRWLELISYHQAILWRVLQRVSH